MKLPPVKMEPIEASVESASMQDHARAIRELARAIKPIAEIATIAAAVILWALLCPRSSKRRGK